MVLRRIYLFNLFLFLFLVNKSLFKIMLQESTSTDVQIDLFIGEEHQLYANLTFSNKAEKDLWLEKRKVAYNGIILINCLIIKDIAKNVILEFTGPMARFRSPIEEDFIIVKPNQTYSTKFRIDNKYAFSDELSTYTIQYTSTMFPLNEQSSIHYKSNIATITY
jgi:hypothetical protein